MSTATLAAETRATIGQFFAALFADAQGLIELRGLPSKARIFAPLGELDRLLRFLAEHARDQDCYVGVAARKDATSGTLENCSTLGAVFADIDFKMTSEDEARCRLTNFPLQPSLVVHSGHGLHAYWLLREPLDLATDEARARELLERVAAALGGDRSAAEPARVLRVPQTWNRKAEPVRVILELYEPTRRYNPAELEEWLPADPTPERRPGDGFHAESAVGVGDRHRYLYRGARALKLKGFSPAVVLAALRVDNAEHCTPPLPDAEIERQVASAFEQADRPGFAPPGAEPNRKPDPTPPLPAEPEWPSLKPEALYGLAGRIVEAIAPHSEADPVAILLHTLVAAGNLLGPGPHARVEQDPHPARFNAVLVGKTSKGRKGTAWSTPRAMLRAVDPEWSLASGLSSGEGLIYHVRDRVERTDPESGETKVLDEGVPDKRLLVMETEFATVLARMGRDGNTLSAVLRDAWDHGDLRTLTKNSPLRATGAHVSLLGHITQEELTRLFTDISMANGFGNRFLWACVRRARLLPDGGGVDSTRLASLTEELRSVVPTASRIGRMTRDPETTAVWHELYPDLSRERDGLVGALLGRAEPQTLRLSLLYAVLDQSPTIRLPHLKAALAVWAYAEASVLYLFGSRLGHPTADAILDALRRAGRLTRTEIRDLFGRHKDAAQIEEALGMLERDGLAKPGRRQTGGRPEEFWETVWTT